MHAAFALQWLHNHSTDVICKAHTLLARADRRERLPVMISRAFAASLNSENTTFAANPAERVSGEQVQQLH